MQGRWVVVLFACGACGAPPAPDTLKVSPVCDAGPPSIASGKPTPDPPLSCPREMQRCLGGPCEMVRERCVETFRASIDPKTCDPHCEAAANCRIRCDHSSEPGCVAACTEALDRDARACASLCMREDGCLLRCFQARCSSAICAMR